MWFCEVCLRLILVGEFPQIDTTNMTLLSQRAISIVLVDCQIRRRKLVLSLKSVVACWSDRVSSLSWRTCVCDSEYVPLTLRGKFVCGAVWWSSRSSSMSRQETAGSLDKFSSSLTAWHCAWIKKRQCYRNRLHYVSHPWIGYYNYLSVQLHFTVFT